MFFNFWKKKKKSIQTDQTKSFEDPLTANKNFEDPLTAKPRSFEDPLTAKPSKPVKRKTTITTTTNLPREDE
nr:hypothetical protein [Candidatus Sigynarchaeota archaeon]